MEMVMLLNGAIVSNNPLEIRHKLHERRTVLGDS